MASVANTAQPLPRGRHGLPRERVEYSQRRRLLEAMIELVAEHGYQNVTITLLVRRARVARRTFYEHFTDREACLLAAYDFTAGEIIEPLLAAFDPVAGIRRRAEAYMGSVLEALARRPSLARMLVVEVGAGGHRALRHRLEMHGRIAEAIVTLNRETRERGVDVPAVSRERALAIVGAAIELMHETIERRGPECLPDLREELAAVVAALIGEPGSRSGGS